MNEGEMHSEKETFYIPGVREFTFNPESLEFMVGGIDEKVRIPLYEAQDVYTIDDVTLSLRKDVTSLDDHRIGLGAYGLIITFPKVRKWITELSFKEKRDLGEKVANTMHNVFYLRKLHNARKGGDNGFHAQIGQHAKGSFRLETMGNCACLHPTDSTMGVNIEGDIREDINLPIASVLHNADTPTQRLSLYAGAGVISWIMQKNS